MTADHYSWFYAEEKLSAAVDTMATSADGLGARLANAWRYHLIHIQKENMPTNDTWLRLQRLGLEFTKKDDPYTGSAVASMKRRKRDTLERFAGEILELYREVRSARRHAEEQNAR